MFVWMCSSCGICLSIWFIVWYCVIVFVVLLVFFNVWVVFSLVCVSVVCRVRFLGCLFSVLVSCCCSGCSVVRVLVGCMWGSISCISWLWYGSWCSVVFGFFICFVVFSVLICVSSVCSCVKGGGFSLVWLILVVISELFYCELFGLCSSRLCVSLVVWFSLVWVLFWVFRCCSVLFR